jgi:hypothetical protein
MRMLPYQRNANQRGERMMTRGRALVVVALLALAAPGLCFEGPDPRTPDGQIAACGGAANWQALGYLEFTVRITSAAGVQGPFLYRWDRQDGYLRLSGPSPAGDKTEVAVDLGSKTGGAWANGKQLAGKKLTETVNWALQRFGEDTLWLTFPLDWRMAGVKVKALPDVAGKDGTMSPAVDVQSVVGDWKVVLDPATGRVSRTVLVRPSGPLTVTWSCWQAHGGVFFAHKRTIEETGETVDVEVLQALPQAPAGAF